MPDNTNFELLLDRRFDSFEELAFLVAAWDADFRQLSASFQPHFILQAQVDGVLVSLGRFGCHLDQRGTTPVNMRTFAFSDPGCPEINWFGHRIDSEVLLAFPTHGEVSAASRPGFSETTFSVDTEELAAFFDHGGGPALNQLLTSSETVIQPPPQLLLQLRHHLQLVSTAASNPQRLSHLLTGFRRRLFSLLLEILRSSSGRRAAPIDPRNRRLLQIATALVETQGDNPLLLSDLCTAAQVSERTLINTFKREVGMTPKAYIKGYRLFKVHRELWRANPSNASISDVANAFGFWHMGQFAADYHKLFGELPSATLKRTTMCM